MREFLDWLGRTMETPKQFGTLHIIALLTLAVFSFALCFSFRNAGDKTYRRILVVVWAVMFVMELIGQLRRSVSVAEDGALVWTYRSSFVPLQLCDTPLYLLLPIAFLQDGKVRDALSAYMSSYILLGGIFAFLFASTIFTDNVYVNAHTLIHHGLQVAVCLFIGVRNRRRLTLRAFLSAIVVFSISVAFVTICNVGMHALYPEEEINMFFISPYFRKAVPILNDGWQRLHWATVILLYVGVVSAFSFVIYGLQRLIVRFLSSRRRRKGD